MNEAIIVVGGGAAGMMAAATAAESGAAVVIVEKNDRLGVKLGITGKGRCNLTNNSGVAEVMENIPGNGKFMYSTLAAFTPAETMEYFEGLGVALKTERGGRVFPESDKATEVCEAMTRHIRALGVEVVRGRVAGMIVEDGRAVGVRTNKGEIRGGAVIIATGGLSYPKTGSTGDGYRIAAGVGHRIEECRGSLVPMESWDSICGEMQGLSLKNVKVSLRSGKRGTVYEEMGEMQFTHYGVSGPLILTASAHIGRDKEEEYEIGIDLKPGLEEKRLEARILRDFEEKKNKAYKNALEGLTARKMIPVLIERSGISAERQVNTIRREERRKLVEIMKDFTVGVRGLRPIREAVITRGGVDVREINPRTMESRKVSGMYFAGEVIDADGYTGGYNLQIAWSTGRAAGKWSSATRKGRRKWE